MQLGRYDSLWPSTTRKAPCSRLILDGLRGQQETIAYHAFVRLISNINRFSLTLSGFETLRGPGLLVPRT